MHKLILFAAMACTGCGTVVNLATPMREGKVYGGVKNDLDFIEHIVNGSTGDSGLLSSASGAPGAAFAAVFIIFPFVDLGLSALGDTLTLPITTWLDSR